MKYTGESWSGIKLIGKFSFSETSFHNWFNSPFLKDHDFVIIRNN